MRILFSLPVHERPDVLVNQLVNLARWCPSSVACVHVSEAASADIGAFRLAAQVSGALLNPTRHQTGRGTGLFHVHASNFRHAREAGVDFDAVALISSNEMLIRPGLHEHVAVHAAGVQIEARADNADWHLFRRELRRDARVAAFLAHLGLQDYLGGQAEGQFFATDLFTEICELFERFFGHQMSGFETEEVVAQTVLGSGSLVLGAISAPFTFQNYCNRQHIDPAFVDRLRAGQGMVLSERLPGTLRSPHVYTANLHTVFGVKRVDRDFNELRSYITKL